MQAIGGYFELADYETGTGFPHNEGILLNTGRNALEYILRSIGVIKRVYLPYYTCEVVLEPIRRLHIPWAYYHINVRFEIAEDICPSEGEYIIANNYFGIKDEYIRSLAEKYGDCLIVDCAQALFAEPIPGIKCFYSTRKFVGVADGGVAYLGSLSDPGFRISDTEQTECHNSHLFMRKQLGAEAGFADYRENEDKLNDQPVRRMSNDTKTILDHIDYEKVVRKRRENFRMLNEALAERNELALPDMETFACPMIYPFVSSLLGDLRKELINNKVFVAKYWPTIQLLNNNEMEYELSNRILPLPCDQRYGEAEMKRIVTIISQFK